MGTCRRLAQAFALALLLPVWLVGVAHPVRAAESRVILISWDGTRWDYPDRTPLPALARMEREGVRSRLVPVFPSSTFPNHVSLATGTYVDRHGIVANVFHDPELGRYAYSKEAAFIEAEPIWAAAERQGVRAASFFWVGSESDWRGRAATYRETPFDDAVPESEKVDRILAWLDLPAEERPRLMLSWWHGADAVGHRYGPDDARVAEQLRAQDAQLARLLAGLDARGVWADTTLIVVGDHGMARVGPTIEVTDALEAAGIASSYFPGGGFAYVTLRDPDQLDAALAALEPLAGLEAFTADTLPSELRARFPRRTGHLTLIAHPPRVLSEPNGFGSWAYAAVASLLGQSFGRHGYKPDQPDMQAIFFALGRGVVPGLELDRVRAIDVAPTVAHLLGIHPPEHSEGRSLVDLRSGIE